MQLRRSSNERRSFLGFWVDAGTAQASLSAKISPTYNLFNVIHRLMQIQQGLKEALGMLFQRQVSSPFSISMEDVSNYDDPFLGLNGMMRLEPLPANLGGGSSERLGFEWP